MKNSFITTAYKTGYIHSCYNPETKQTEYRAQVANVSKDCFTLTGSKRIVTALIEDKKHSRNAFVGY